MHPERKTEVFMRKYILLFIAAALMACCLCACGSKAGASTAARNTYHIVTTIFPEYDWVKNILGDNPADIEVSMLLDNGVDLHSYQPSADDILTISTCDLFIYVGGESDKWVRDVLRNAENKNMKVIDLIEILGDKAKEEELVEGMEGEEEEDADEEEGPEYDEHVWLSLRNVSYFTKAIADAIRSIDSVNADIYSKNASAYLDRLDALDKKYQESVSKAKVKTLLFGDRFPFRYLTEDYGLSYYAAFIGCSAETEASFETITFLAGKVNELKLDAVITIEGSDRRIAETIIKNTESKDQKILTLNSLQAVKSADIEQGASYLSIMEDNLNVLREALSVT